jgi:very-short-patch-repair endonuclease
MAERPKESLGIVTMNAGQKELVEGLIEDRLKNDPIAQRYIEERSAGLEPFFIKNLENVQGDERDVIYISITYGRDAQGHFFQRFGPITGATGHRRLNVLFTRARRRVVLFASMTADDIKILPTSSRGLRAFKGYLHFAKTGVLDQATFSGREPDSDFEIQVATLLQARGYGVVAQVGVAGYFIDLAIKHPTRRDSFILGIECDGRTYHSSLSARDRDRLRQAVLEDLGWNIHRIWSTDWFKQAPVEVERIARRVDAILERERTVEEFSPAEQLESDDGEARVDAEDWEGEAREQPLDLEDARQQLLELAERIESERPVSEGARLLRSEMTTALLRMRPRNRQDFLQLPLDLRLDTDGEELQTYLGDILAITSRMER